jgi:hypothetical protein
MYADLRLVSLGACDKYQVANLFMIITTTDKSNNGRIIVTNLQTLWFNTRLKYEILGVLRF